MYRYVTATSDTAIGLQHCRDENARALACEAVQHNTGTKYKQCKKATIRLVRRQWRWHLALAPGSEQYGEAEKGHRWVHSCLSCYRLDMN